MNKLYKFQIQIMHVMLSEFEILIENKLCVPFIHGSNQTTLNTDSTLTSSTFINHNNLRPHGFRPHPIFSDIGGAALPVPMLDRSKPRWPIICSDVFFRLAWNAHF